MGAFSETDDLDVQEGKITPSQPIGFAVPKPPQE
jgi:hypothetical protein